MIASGSGLPSDQRCSNSSNPGDAVGRSVLPDEFVVLGPALAGLVQAAHEGGRRPVRLRMTPGLAVQRTGRPSGRRHGLRRCPSSGCRTGDGSAAAGRLSTASSTSFHFSLRSCSRACLAASMSSGSRSELQTIRTFPMRLDLLVDEVEDRRPEVPGDAQVLAGARSGPSGRRWRAGPGATRSGRACHRRPDLW